MAWLALTMTAATAACEMPNLAARVLLHAASHVGAAIVAMYLVRHDA